MNKFITKNYLYITTLFVFTIYLITMAPGVTQIDAGELAAVQSTLGIAHPTGYPTFTILGYLFQLIPLPVSTIIKLNLLAAIWSTAAVFMFMKSADLILINFTYSKIEGTKKKAKPKKDLSELSRAVLVSSAALILAFNKTFWIQSTSVEVYSLHLIWLMGVIYFLMKAYYEENNSKLWLFASFFLGLGFSNHMTTLLIIPGFAYLFYKKNGFNKKTFMLKIKMASVFILTLILNYIYLPLRASANPHLNWGNPINFENFWRHFTGKQYQVWLFSSTDSAKKQLTYFFENLPGEFAYIGLFAALIGLYFAFRYNKTLAVFFSVSLVFTVGYSINYDIVDIDSYFLLANISLAFFSLFFLLFIIHRIDEVKKNKQSIFLILPGIFMLVINFNGINKSGEFIYEDYTKAILNSAPKNSAILSYQWDYWVSPSYYFQLVENHQSDVKVIDKELLRRSWYFNQLENNYPGILNPIRDEVEEFLSELKLFERDENFNSAKLERLYRSIIGGIINHNIETSGMFIGPEFVDNEIKRGEIILSTGLKLVPYQFLYKVIKDNEYVEQPDYPELMRFQEKDDRYTNVIKQIVTSQMLNRAVYELQFSQNDKAKKILLKLLTYLPDTKINPQLLEASGLR